MYNYNSDMSHDDPDYIVEVHNSIPQHKKNNGTWLNRNFCFLNRWAHSKSRYGQHQLLSTTGSPTISACTTATNLSSLDSQFGSTITNNRRMGTLEENLRVAQPEIEPLQTKTGVEELKGSINGSACSIHVYNETTTKRPPAVLFRQIIAALSVSLVSMVVGFVSAFTAPAEERIKKDLNIADQEYSWVTSLMPLGALVGGLVGGQLIEFLGRKSAIIITDLLFIISWIVIAAGDHVGYLYAGRGIAGLSVGIASLAFPVYLGETIQPEVRGTLGLLPTAFGNVGILLCFVAGSYLQWYNLAWLGAALPTPFLFLMFLIPETPRWYVSKGKDEKAKATLQWLRGQGTDINDEFNDLIVSQQESDAKSSESSITDLFSKAYVKPLLISLGLMLFQQFSGINAVIFYTTNIFEMAGSTIDKNLCTIIVGLVNFISTFIATILIDRLGRKILLYISSVSMTLTLGTLGTYFYLVHQKADMSQFGWLPLASFVLFVLGFSLGFGPIPWLMMGEILPAKIRGSAASLATAFNWCCTFVVTKTFVDIIRLIGAYGTFWFFAAVCVLSVVFVMLWVPETQGQSLQDIERKLAGYKVRRMSSVANLKPLPSGF